MDKEIDIYDTITFNEIEQLTLQANLSILVMSETIMAIDLDRGVSELRLYINKLRDFRQKHNLPGMYFDAKKKKCTPSFLFISINSFRTG